MYAVAEEKLYPRDAEHRYRLYARRGDELEVLAVAPDMAGVGAAIGTIHDDEKGRGRRLSDLGATGILDAVAGEWIVLPWQRPDQAATVGPSQARLAAGFRWEGRRVRSATSSTGRVWTVGPLGPFGHRMTCQGVNHAVSRTPEELERFWIIEPEGDR